MAVNLLQLLQPFAVALVAAFVVLYGNYRLQSRVARRLRDADEIKSKLYELLDLSAKYWTTESVINERRVLEARIISSQLILASELSEMQRYSRKLTYWYKETERQRLDLMDAVSGGCFQQAQWQVDPQRIPRAGKDVRHIVKGLNRSC